MEERTARGRTGPAGVRQPKRTPPDSRRLPGAEPGPGGPAVAPRRADGTVSDPARLAAEVARLQAELGKNLPHRDTFATVLRKPRLTGV